MCSPNKYSDNLIMAITTATETDEELPSRALFLVVVPS